MMRRFLFCCDDRFFGGKIVKVSYFCRNFLFLENALKKGNPRTVAVLGFQVVETTGLEPVTSCV